MAGEDEVRIDASLNDDISEAVARIEARLRSLEDEVGKLGRAGAKGGAEFAAGMDKAAQSADEVGDQARQARKPVKELGDETAKTGTKAVVGGKGLDSFARKANKASRRSQFLRTTILALSFAGVITGVFALAGGLSALGAGAVIAIGGLAPMVGVVAGALPIFAAAKLSMVAWKLAATHLEPVLTRIKNQFTELGTAIAHGGLESGLEFFADHLDGLAEVSKRGLAGLGGQIGLAAREVGGLVSSAPFLSQIERIFHGLEPIVGNLTKGLINLGRALINILEAAMPMTQDMAETFEIVTRQLMNWTAEQLANGRMTAWLNKSWALFKRTVGVVVDFLVGVFNIFRAGAGYAGEMGASIEQAAEKFRLWTGSAEGQARINQYFQDSLPALREMGKLLAMIASGLGGLAANQNVAPLLAQIRTEFAPALSDLVANLSGQDGLGPALISAATAMLRFMAALDFSALTLLIQGLAVFIEGVIWIMQNVPGASFLISGMIGAFLGFKLLGPIIGLANKALKAYRWVLISLTADTKKLTAAQRVFAATVVWVGNVFKAVATAMAVASRALWAALLANPIILIVAVIVAALVFMWFKFAWFRDLVMTVWEAIKTTAVTVFNAIMTAVRAVVDIAVTVWRSLVTAWNAVVDAIKTAAMWLWTNVFQPVWKVISGAAVVAFNIIKFIVQTVVYIIMVAVWLIATVVEAVFKTIISIAKWAWETVLAPLFQVIASVATAVWNAIATAATVAWNLIVAGAMWLWNTVLFPMFTVVRDFVVGVWNAVMGAAQAAWNAISTGAGIAWNNFLAPIFNTIRSVGTAIWNAISGVASAVWNAIRSGWNGLWSALKPIFDAIGSAGRAVWDGIKAAAEAAGSIIKGIWNGITGIIKSVWNVIANVWNSIPTVTVPDWVPMVGGSTFGLPKMPVLWHGGEAPGGRALVGEHGPEPVVVNGQVAGMVGVNGPEVTNIPTGGYVVPNLSTLSALPGLTKTLPSSVAAAVARSVPGYADALGASTAGGADGRLSQAVDRLAGAVGSQMPPVHIHNSGNVREDVLDAWRTIKREDEARGRYNYQTAGR